MRKSAIQARRRTWVRLARELGLLAAVVAALALAGFALQRLFIPRAVPAPDIPRSLDERLKPLVVKQIRAENRLVEEPFAVRTVAAIASRLAPDSPEVILVDSPLVNAFAVPGGVVCVSTGLVKALGGPEELAAIVAHEMSHVAHRDPIAQLARRVCMASLAAVLTGGQGETLVQGLLADLVTLRYGREAENRADNFAVQLLAGAGIDPRSYAAALTRIRDTGLKHPGLFRYLDPHSPIDERIAAATQAAESAAAGRAAAWEPVAADWKKLLKALPTVLEPEN